MRRMQAGFAAFVAALVAVVLLVPTGATGAKSTTSAKAVHSKSDAARQKLDSKLTKLVQSGSNNSVLALATVRSDAAQAAATKLKRAHIAKSEGRQTLVVGSLRVQQVTKLAGTKGVLAVHLIELKRTALPPGIPEPNLNQTPSNSSLQSFMNALRQKEVPYSAAPAPKGSNFEALKQLGVLDAKTHRFADAWNNGWTGEGSTVGVLDGGTDFGHPDLLGTWKTWSGATDT